MRRVASLGLCFMALIVLAGEARAGGAPHLRSVPRGSVAVLRVKWGVVRRDARLREFVKGDDLERIMTAAGIGSADVNEAAIFIDISSPTSARSAMVMSGGPRLRTASAGRAAAGWGAASYRGLTLFSDPSQANCLASLRSGFVALGTRAGVEAVIDAELSPSGSALSDARFRKLLAESDAARHPVSLMMLLPEAAQDAADVAVKAASFLLNLTGFWPLGKLLDSVGLARGVSFSISHSGGSFPASFVALMKDESAATIVSGTFSLLKGATSWLPARNESEADREVRLAFQNMTVARARDTVSVRLTVPGSLVR
jgi:hypothetical protein